MILKSLSYIFLALLIIGCGSPLLASSFLMGRLVTVHPYGASDASRNPALMARQKQRNAFGLAGNYQTYASADLSIQQGISRIKAVIDHYDAGTAQISYIKKIDIFAIGLDVSGTYNNSREGATNLAWDTLFYFGNGSSTNTQFTSTGTIAFSAALGRHSLGIQLNCTYNNQLEKEKIRSIQISKPPVLFQDISKNKYEMISSVPVIGYLCTLDTTEIGFMFSAGALSWKKEKKEGFSSDLSPLLAQISFKGRGTLPYYFSYTRGPGFTAGAFTQASADLGIGLEFDVTIPVSYRDQYLIRLDKTISPLGRFRYFRNSDLHARSTVVTKPSFSVRGGIETGVSQSATISLGAGFDYNSSSSENKNPVSDPMMTSYLHSLTLATYGMAGIDIRTGKTGIVTLGSIVTYYTVSQENTYAQMLKTLGREIHNNKIKFKTIAADVFIASSVGF